MERTPRRTRVATSFRTKLSLLGAPVFSYLAASTFLAGPRGWDLVYGVLFALAALGCWIELVFVLWRAPRRGGGPGT